MSKATTGEADVLRLRQNVQTLLRRRALEAVELVLEEELTEALGTARYERGAGRRGYRHGSQTRRITTALGSPFVFQVNPPQEARAHGPVGVRPSQSRGRLGPWGRHRTG